MWGIGTPNLAIIVGNAFSLILSINCHMALPVIIMSTIQGWKYENCNAMLIEGKLDRSNYQNFKIAFDNNPIPMWLVAKDDFSIIYVNKAVINHYGYTISELKQITIKDIEIKGDPEEQLCNSQHVVKHIKKCGAVIYVKMIFYDMEINRWPMLLISTIDITDELNIREFVYNSKVTVQSILQTSNVGYLLFDMELKIFSFNQNAAKFAYNKYNIGLEKGVCLTNYFPADKFPHFVDSAIKALYGANIKYEIYYEQPNELIFWYEIKIASIKDYNGSIIGILISINDITERKKTRKDLCCAYNRIKDQIENMQTVAWKQSHLIRQPLANLKALLLMLIENPSDEQVLAYIQSEFEKMDTVIIEMDNDVFNLVRFVKKENML